MLAVDPDAVVINSFSKYWSMTGWRLGWIVVPDSLIDAVERLQQNLYICAPHISQVVALAAFDATEELDGHVERYRHNRAILLDGLAAAGITEIAAADGAFYVYADVSHLTDDSHRLAAHAPVVGRDGRRCHVWHRLRSRPRARIRPVLLRRRRRRHGRGLRPPRTVAPMTSGVFPDPTPKDRWAGALDGLRVIDLSTVLAGPNCARYLADFGADVIKVERPGGDSLRNMAWRDPRDGEGLWWKLVNRNKRTVVLDLKDEADRAVLLVLVDGPTCSSRTPGPARSSVWASGPTCCSTEPGARDHPGQRVRPGRPVRIASGLRHDRRGDDGLSALSGEPDGQPLLPPIALTDEVTGSLPRSPR